MSNNNTLEESPKEDIYSENQRLNIKNDILNHEAYFDNLSSYSGKLYIILEYSL